MHRRDFILTGLVALPALKSDVFAGSNCRPTATNIIGPAYRKGAPFRTNLCDYGEPGEPLTMFGRVTAADTCRPLAGATLDVWQVDARGEYDMDSDKFHLRGKLRPDRAGRYQFDTIVPVPYGVRPKHIHYLVTRPGYVPLITQCYFEGDARNQTDRYVKPSLIIALGEYLHPARAKRYRKGAYDIGLERERPVSRETVKTFPLYVGEYLLPGDRVLRITLEGDKLLWHLPHDLEPGEPTDGELIFLSGTRFRVPEHDVTGSFVRDEHGRVTHILNDGGMMFKKIK